MIYDTEHLFMCILSSAYVLMEVAVQILQPFYFYLTFSYCWVLRVLCIFWMWSEVKVTQSCLILCNLMDCIDIVHEILQARTLEWVPVPFSKDLPNPGIKPRFPPLQVDFLPAEPQRKPKNTGVGSLSLLQWIFLTQESNWGLLYCRQNLYQLSYQGIPQHFGYMCYIS